LATHPESHLTHLQGVVSRRAKKDSVLGLITDLSEDIPVLQTYREMFPTDDLKHALAEFYIHTVDFLWRLANYYSHRFFREFFIGFERMHGPTSG
jgi:hypothetical protein